MDARPRSNPFFSLLVLGANMAAVRVKPKTFEKRYKARAKALADLASTLPDRPSPDEIHDLRVTIRRIQIMRRLLPRTIRMSQTSKHYDLVLKSVLKTTSQLRDLDTLVDTLEHQGNLPADLLVTLQNQRSDAAARAKAATELLSDAPTPELDPSVLGKKQLSRRLGRVLRKRSRVAVDLLNQVVRDESKVEELHSLRKEVKKLRYFMELMDDGEPELPILTKWQEALGAVHDFDITVSYLQGQGTEVTPKVVRDLQLARHRSYLKFVAECKSDFMEVLEDSNLLGRDNASRSRAPLQHDPRVD